MSYEKEGPLPGKKEQPKQSLEDWLYDLGNLAPEDFEAEVGSHLPPDRLR